MIVVRNLKTNEELHFMDDVGEAHAVRWAWANERRMTVKLKDLEHFVKIFGDKAAANRLLNSCFPLIRGECTVACGDWCALTK